MTKYLILISLFIITSCAVGPLTSHETARSNGKGNHQLVGGLGNSGVALKWNYGLTENLDLGLQIESYSTGIRAKYSFINEQDKGWSLAAAAGTGVSIGGSHYYGDLMGSYLSGKWEPYTNLRIVKVEVDEMEFEDEDTGETQFTIDSARYSYGHYFLGTRYFLTENWLISGEVSTIFRLSSVSVSNAFVYSLGLGYKF